MNKPKIWRVKHFWFCGDKDDKSSQGIGRSKEEADEMWRGLKIADQVLATPLALYVRFMIKSAVLVVWNILLACLIVGLVIVATVVDLSWGDRGFAALLALSSFASGWLALDYTVEKMEQMWSEL